MKRLSVSTIRLLSLLFILTAFGWWWATRTQAGSWWWAAVLNVIPPQVLLPWPLLLAWAAARHKKRGWVLLNLLSAAVFTVSVVGLLLPRAAAKVTGSPVALLTLNTDWASAPPEELAQLAVREGVQVITLQEGLPKSAGPNTYETALRTAFPGWTVVRFDELITLSKFPVLQSRPLKFPNSLHAVQVTQVRAGGQTLTVVNAHLPAPKLLASGSDRAKERNLQQRMDFTLAIRRDFQKVAGQLIRANNHPLVIAGDLNAPPRGGVWYQLRSLGLRDAFLQAGRGFGFTHHAVLGHSRIDYVWLRGAQASQARPLRDVLSDHRALLVQVMLPENGP